MLETLYTTNQLHQDSANLTLERSLRTLSISSTAGSFLRPVDEAVNKCISGLQSAAKEYSQVGLWHSLAAADAAAVAV